MVVVVTNEPIGDRLVFRLGFDSGTGVNDSPILTSVTPR